MKRFIGGIGVVQKVNTNIRKHSLKAEPPEGSAQRSSWDSDPGASGTPAVAHLSFSRLCGVLSPLLQWGS